MSKFSRVCDSAEIELKEDYVHIQFRDMSIIGLEESKKVADLIIELCAGTPYPFITNGLGITIRMNNEARDFFASYPPLTKVRKAQALLVNNMPSKLLANFFIKYHKPVNPTKIFTDFDEALKWIRSLPA
jgi:hypothetical protein